MLILILMDVDVNGYLQTETGNWNGNGILGNVGYAAQNSTFDEEMIVKHKIWQYPIFRQTHFLLTILLILRLRLEFGDQNAG